MFEQRPPVVPITSTNPVFPNTVARFQPRYIGPMGSRVSAVAGVVGNPLVYYVGAAAGGIFKTSDGGTTWQPIFDEQAAAIGDQPLPEKVSSIGALAVSESDHEIVWAGTGESWIRGHVSIGNGVYKSADGGSHWTRMGLNNSGRISKIVIHPTCPNIVWVAVVGSCYAPSTDRGVYKTTDGGLTWTCTLHTNDQSGCSDLAIDPNNPDVFYAGMWEFKLRSWVRLSGGPGSGLYKSSDGGVTWKELTNGLPTGELAENGKPYPVGKIAVGVARSDSNYVYANIETGDGEPSWAFPHVANGQLWQSTDAGASWTLKNYNRSINSRAAYYTRNAVSPDNKHEVYFFGPELVVTTDGGETLDIIDFPQAPGVDHHEGWIDPTNGDRIAVACDSGISISLNRGQTWYKRQLANAQVYGVNVDDPIPYNVFGNVQDWVSAWGPINARNTSQRYAAIQEHQMDAPGAISRDLWRFAGGGESGYSIPDPKDPDIIWSSGGGDGPQGGHVALLNRKTEHWRIITVRPRFTTGSAPKDVEFRFHWHFPMTISPHDRGVSPCQPRRVYVGCQFVLATDDRGQSWYQLGDQDFTGYDERFLQASGGLTGDNLANRMAYCLSAIAESPVEPGLLWLGTHNQRVWMGKE